MTQQKSAIEMLLDENNTDNLFLFNEFDELVEFEQIAVIPLEEKVFAILCPVEPLEGMEQDEGLVFAIEEIDNEDCLVIVEDADTINAVFDLYYKLLEEEQ